MNHRTHTTAAEQRMLEVARQNIRMQILQEYKQITLRQDAQRMREKAARAVEERMKREAAQRAAMERAHWARIHAHLRRHQ